MKKLILISLLALTSCSAPQVAATVTPVILPPAQMATVQQTCQIAGPLLNVAADPSLPAKVSETATFGATYCNQLNAGTVPPTTDANTPSWLTKVIKGVQIAAAIAKVALPLIKPLF